MNCTLLLLGLAVVGIAVFGALVGQPHHFVFDQNELHRIAKKAINDNDNIEGIIEQVTKDLEAKYPGHINPKHDWVFNNAGSAMGAMTLLHASLSEYVIIFGTPIGTDGHTGRFTSDDYFIILDGEQWAFSPGSLRKEVYKPGEMHHLGAGEAQAYRMPDQCWALEYARGNIPFMLPFGLADTFFSTLDFYTLYKTFAVYGERVIAELLQGKI